MVHKYNVRLTDGQKRKIAASFRARRNATISLRYEQISTSGGVPILLNDEQFIAITNAVKRRKGIRLTLSFDQMRNNINGGLLKEILEKIENVVPYAKSIVSPLVKRKLAPMLKDRFLPWLKGLIDNELDTIIERDPKGSGLKLRINKKIDSLLSQASKKNNKTTNTGRTRKPCKTSRN